MNQREHDRIPYAVRVQFRTASSLLVAYSANLSRGGVFLETEAPLPEGSAIQLELTGPGGGTVTLDGRVTWTRGIDHGAEPPGMGVEFSDVSDELGALIDQLVSDFHGINILLVCEDERTRKNLTRAIRSFIATAEVVGASDPTLIEALLGEDIDLTVVDADSLEIDALPIVHSAVRASIPTLVITDNPAVDEQVKGAGADAVLTSPNEGAELRRAILRSLGRPSSVSG